MAAVVLWCIGATVPARADNAVLANGFRIHVERREDRRQDQRSLVRLFVAGGGYVDIAAEELQGYEKEEAAPAAPDTMTPSAAPAVASSEPTSLPSLLSSAGYRQGLDPALLKSMIAEESSFNSRAVSPKGAAGLMQLMPGTAQLLGVKDSYDAVENVQGGAFYIRSLLDRYQGDLAKALAAYNAGPDKVDRYRGIPPYTETQNYVRRVITRFNREKTKQ